MELKKIYGMVKETLEAYPDTRNSDDLLIATIYMNYFHVKDEPFYLVMATRRSRKYPAPASIDRARRRVVNDHPDLRGDKKTEDARLEKQLEFIKFSQEVM